MRFGYFAAIVLTAVATVAQARADETPYGVEFAKVGQPMSELQDSKTFPEGRHIFCDSDKTTELGKGDQEIIRVSDAQSQAGIARCGLYGKEASGTWTNRAVGLGGSPAEMWILTLEESGVRKIMQLQFFQPKEAVESTLRFLSATYGNPTSTTSNIKKWNNGISEIAVTHKDQGGLYVFYTDQRLYQDMRQRLGLPKLN